ncbi:hypothetical protein CALVIDRAFT_526596 [Calocera viscosa TUFC12733]|uniref:Protein N-terminal glutamine amidohydrolase n=1 Tax=Calocera viscosa (strain TUFC12733) TaxID=1330018 RepID=A0A167NN31_CALVF|nr:hypothetical protein CALVIDRAFT_526596 [Calocera viscosa TUFC12733]
MSQPALAAFDPFKTHPFTRAGSAPGANPSTAPSASQGARPIPVAAPQPRRAPMPSPPTAAEPIFTRFELERKTPDLVLKKLSGNWGAKDTSGKNAVPEGTDFERLTIHALGPLQLASSEMNAPTPPPLPTELFYTPNYCEENVYCLAQAFRSRPEVESTWDIYALFISNDSRCVALWQQKSTQAWDDGLVLWDYHCVLVMFPRILSNLPEEAREGWVYDGNSLLGIPIPWSSYLKTTFRNPHHVPDRYRCKFRVVKAKEFLDWFASDRSHMVIWDDTLQRHRYISEPPQHPAIIGSAALRAGITSNLMERFVSMRCADDEEEHYGIVMDNETICRRANGRLYPLRAMLHHPVIDGQLALEWSWSKPSFTMDVHQSILTSVPTYFSYTALTSSSSPLQPHHTSSRFQMQTRSQKRRRSPSGSEQISKPRPSKRRITEQTLTLTIPEPLCPLPGSASAQWPQASSSFAPRIGSPMESTLSGTPSPAPSAWAPSEVEYAWSALKDEPTTRAVHADFLQATQGMRIDDSRGDVDADMDTYQDELLSASSISTKDFTIPELQLQPPTPLLFQSPQHSNAPTSPTATHGSPVPAMTPTRPSGVSPARKRFIMGPREGCEKCRLKVPGHYGHIE